MGFEPTASSLGNWSSTPELPPLLSDLLLLKSNKKWFKTIQTTVHLSY